MHPSAANEQYLQTMVLTASPAKLRHLLLERAVTLSELIQENRLRRPEILVDERTVTLRDILGELLSGVKRSTDPLSATVADLYVFLLQELTMAEREPGLDRIASIGHILEIERETWKQVCEHLSKRRVPQPMGGQIPGATSKLTSLNLNG
jgi:flagellar protein FliS